MRWGCFGLVVLIGLPAIASATIIDFSDQAPVTDALDSFSMSFDGKTANNVYAFSNGLTVTFNGFGRNAEDAEYIQANNGSAYGSIWSTGSTASIVFNKSVKVSSFSVNNYFGNYDNGGGDSYLFTANGTGPNQSFPELYLAPTADPMMDGGTEFWQVSGNSNFTFADYAITELDFTNFDSVFFDDLTFELAPPLPEPTAGAGLGLVLVGTLIRRRRFRRK